MKEAVIVAGARTPGGKAPRGILRDVRPEYLGKLAIEGTLKKLGANFSPDLIEDVIWGCAAPEQATGLNIGRITAAYAGVPLSVPAVTVNRFCSSGLQAIAFAAEAILAGRCDVVLAGGVEHMSLIPNNGLFRPSDALVDDPELAKLYMFMGLTAENVARRYHISRSEQDGFALLSHLKAAEATRNGKFLDEIAPVPVKISSLGADNKMVTEETILDQDEGIRFDASSESLSKLPPAFVSRGSVTAGNSSQTTDGAAATILMSAEKAAELGHKPYLKFLGFSVAGCEPDEMGVGPVYAVPKVLKKTGLSIKDIGLVEFNEAFACQAVFCLRELNIPREKVNVNGGAIALGHPMGATGAKLTVTLMNEMRRRQVQYGMVTMCIGGGQGAAAVYELC